MRDILFVPVTTRRRSVRNYLIGAGYAVMSAFVGMLLPFASALGPIRRPTNLLFGFIYGFGWFIGGFIENVRSPNVELFGSLIWPFMMIVMMTYFLGSLLSSHSDRRPAIMLGCLVLLAFIISGDFIQSTPLKYVPTYSSILFVVY
jgi:hypothetical protein